MIVLLVFKINLNNSLAKKIRNSFLLANNDPFPAIIVIKLKLINILHIAGIIRFISNNFITSSIIYFFSINSIYFNMFVFYIIILLYYLLFLYFDYNFL